MRWIATRLRQWGDLHIKYFLGHDGFSSINVLHRVAREGQVQKGQPRDVVLCADLPDKLPEHVRREFFEVEQAVHKLSNYQEKAIRAFYCAPVKEDGQLYTQRELSKMFKFRSLYRFRECLRNGKNVLERALE